jgi:hypothetical protein
VHFPYIDPRDETDDIDGNYGYVHFFTRKVLFDDCHFYTLWSKEDFPTNYVKFDGCVFYTDYNIIGLDYH